MRIFKNINIFIFFVVLLNNCQKEQTTEIMSKPCNIPDIEKILVGNSNQLGFELFKQLSVIDEVGENLLISPIGITLSLNSLLQASDNITNSEIKRFLQIRNFQDTSVCNGFNHLNILYSEIDYHSKIQSSSKITLSQDISIEPGFTSFDVKSSYAEVIKDDDAGFIEDINDKFSERDNNAFQMINSFLFNSNSKYQTRIEESPFYKSPNESNFIEMIVSKSQFNYYSDQTVKAVELPLGRGNFNILLIIPKNSETILDLCNKLDKKLLERIKKKFRPQYLEVIMPKIDLTGVKTLKSILKNNRLSSGFIENSADFSKLSKQSNLYMSDFEHIVSLNISSNAEKQVSDASDLLFKEAPILIDHPFIFIIYEKYSEGILFIGKIGNL